VVDAWQAFAAEVTPAIEDPARIVGVEALGVDETGFLAGTARRQRIFATGMVDVHWGILIDIIEGRSAKILAFWLAERAPHWLAHVQIVCIDPLGAYRAGLSPSLSHGAVVADPLRGIPRNGSYGKWRIMRVERGRGRCGQGRRR
jgi:transposase